MVRVILLLCLLFKKILNLHFIFRTKYILILKYERTVIVNLGFFVFLRNVVIIALLSLTNQIQDRIRKQCTLRGFSSISLVLRCVKELEDRGHMTLVNEQGGWNVQKYSFARKTINEWNTFSADCVHARAQ